MKILVPVKRVIDPYAKVRPLPDGSAMDTAGVKFEINPFDEIALEEAARIKEVNPATEVIAASIGRSECEDQLRKALALAADRAILVETDDELDSWVVTEELLALVRELQPDLVLMGKQTTDDDGNQVGQMLAALLDWPQATFAAKLTLSNKSLSVTRETDTGEETLAMELPAVVTTDLRLNEPRYVALPGIIKARSKPLERRGRATATKAKMRAIAYEAPPQRKAGTKVGTIDELIAAIRQTGVLS